MIYYLQICCMFEELQLDGYEIDTESALDELKKIACMSESERYPRYIELRNLCLKRGIMRVGEIFNPAHCVGLEGTQL